MKKIFTLSGIALLSLAVHAQTSHTDNFDGYTAGQALGPQSTSWTTWSGAEGGTEDVLVVNNDANSAPNSLYFSSTSATGGPSDVVAYFGGQHNTGTFTYQQDMKLDANKGAYFNFQANTTIGQLWALEVYVNQSGAFQMSNTNGVLLTGNFPTGSWFTLTFDINLNQNIWDVKVNSSSVGSFQNSINQIASIDIFPVNAAQPIGGNNNAGFWVDNVSWLHTPYVLPAVNGAITASGIINPATRAPGVITGIVGQQRHLAATIRNLGVAAITSFDISVLYNSGTQNQTVTSVNIASLATYTFVFAAPTTLAMGNMPVTFTISNVNGAGADGDPADNSSVANANITVVPAPGKMVVGEEGTGTWCQWCPRGAIYMDYMAESYEGYWAGVAVHNGDPMVHTAYDLGVGSLIAGYPSGLVDRGPEADPSTFEGEFLTRVSVPPHASIVNGAEYSVSGDSLHVSLTYIFAIAGSNQYRVACVLTEDSVTGTSGYNQSNAYANNAAGPMGGFESLPSSVPASQMNYNHVARGISPSFAGYAGFPASVPVGSVHRFTFSFAIPAGWDTSEFHIVGMLIAPNGEIDNASNTTGAEAITNGFVTGIHIFGGETPAQPDAMNVYPNPSTGMAFASVDLATSQEVIMTIRDVTGKVVAQRNYGELIG
ncbi:MAG TPA: hypothetical protein VK826_11025, partial [Bacteroidia bacterium]|nr:hypothetical protein [Bacteroidia bacterium]